MSKPGAPKLPWTPPTRRAFLAMLGAGAAALTVSRRADAAAPAPTPAPPPALPRWIGHC